MSPGVPSPRYKIVELGTLLQNYLPYKNNPNAFFATSEAYSINDHGQVVGGSTACTPSGQPESQHAFLWENGKMSDLGVLPQGTGSKARAINEKGQVVGVCSVKDGCHAFLWQRGKMRDLGTLGGSVSVPLLDDFQMIHGRLARVGDSFHAQGDAAAPDGEFYAPP